MPVTSRAKSAPARQAPEDNPYDDMLVRFDRAAFSILDSNAVPTGRVETAPLHDLHFVARVRSPQGERDIERVVLRECGDHL